MTAVVVETTSAGKATVVVEGEMEIRAQIIVLNYKVMLFSENETGIF